MKAVSYLSVSLPDKSRPTGRPPKTTWKIEIIKKAMKALQHASPRKVAEVVWHFFTMPGKVYFSEPQRSLIERAKREEMIYRGDKIIAYRWGSEGARILLCHGWRSKAADFRRMIESYLEAGFVVEAIDCRAHGNSGGKHTALPEYREIIKQHIEQNGPYEIVLGYSMGGAAAGIAVSELPKNLQPQKLFLVAAPPFIRYFFKDIVKEVGLKETVYQQMVNLLEEVYDQSVDYFDLRSKSEKLANIEKYFIYCEDDDVIPFSKGMDLYESFDDGHFVQARGFGHYKIISNERMIHYLVTQSKTISEPIVPDQAE